MRECPHCLADVMVEAARVCPSCGEALGVCETEYAPNVSAIIDLPLAGDTAHWPSVGVLWMKADVVGEVECGRIDPPGTHEDEEHDFLQNMVRVLADRAATAMKYRQGVVVGIFGAPSAHESDIHSVLRAALEIRELAALERHLGHRANVRIGVALGSMSVESIEPSASPAWKLTGDTVETAERLAQYADVGEILICPQTARLAGRCFELEPPSQQDAAAFEGFLLIDLQAAETMETEKSVFCGRARELAQLIEFFMSPSNGDVHTARVVGEAGIGKTRLVEEALRQGGVEPRAVWWRCEPGGEAAAFGPALDWLNRHLQLGSVHTAALLSHAIRDRLATRPAVQDADVTLIEYLYGLPEAVEAVAQISPDNLEHGLASLFIRQICDPPEQNPQPVVLVVDNFQWADPTTARLIERLARNPIGGQMRIVLIERSEETIQASSIPVRLTLELATLDGEEQDALLANLCPTEDFLPEIRELLLERADGHPLFLQAMTRLVHEVIEQYCELNGQALINRIVEVIPASLEELLQARLDRLSDRSRQALDCLALLGPELAVGLADALDEIGDDLSAQIKVLRDMKFLDAGEGPASPLPLRLHDLYRECAYRAIDPERRRRLHETIARGLERRWCGRLMEHYERLAFHYSRGTSKDKALYYLVKAGDRETNLGEKGTALKNYREALKLLHEMPAERPNRILMSRILIRCGRIERACGNHAEAGELLAGALECAETAECRRLALEARLEQTLSRIGGEGQSESHCQALETLADEAARLDAPVLETIALNALGVAHWRAGSLERALTVFQGLARLAGHCGAAQVQSDAFNNAGLIYWQWGQYAQSLKAFRRSLAVRRRLGDIFGLCATLSNLGIISEQMGETGAARKTYHKALGLARQSGHVQALAALESNLSNLERRLGSLHMALAHAGEALKWSRLAEDANLEAAALENLSLALARRGEPAEAQKHFAEAFGIAQSNGFLEQETRIELEFLELGLDASDQENCLRTGIDDLIERIDRQKYHELLSQALRIKGRLLIEGVSGDPELALEALRQAIDCAHGMGNLFEERECLQALHAVQSRIGLAVEASATEEAIARIDALLEIGSCNTDDKGKT